MKINAYLPIAILYFFLNSLALPFGLTYTVLLAPFFYAWILWRTKKEVLLPFFAVMIPFMLAHVLLVGVVGRVYVLSLINLAGVYIFCYAFYVFLKRKPGLEKIFRYLLVINFLLCLVALLIYPTRFYNILWIQQEITPGVFDFKRLNLFTYEASYYATLMVPVFVYFLLQYFLRQNKIRGWLLLLMIFLPYVLSFSLGVIGSLLLAGILTTLVHTKRLLRKPRIFRGLAMGISGLGIAGAVSYFFFRENALMVRLGNIFSGVDTSGKGRTIDAYLLANKMLETKNEWWGIGVGQVKIIGYQIIKDYYRYITDFTATIPNATAETLAIFGWLGLTLRLCVEIFLFFQAKVWRNYYQLLLFFFVFIYQFTGSFITNVAEYVIWILAFTNVFTCFDVKQKINVGAAPPVSAEQLHLSSTAHNHL
jgi:hypothetical protein